MPAAGDDAAREAHDEAQVQKVLAAMRATKPAGIEKMGAERRAQFRDAREHEPGLNGLHDPAVPLQRYRRLVKPNLDCPWEHQNPSRPQTIKVSIRGNGELAEPMQRVLQRLDLQAPVD